MHTTAQEQGVILAGKFLGPDTNLRFQIQGMLHAARQMAQGIQIGTLGFDSQLSTQFGQRAGQCKQGDELGGEGLGRGHADFCTSSGVDQQIRRTRNSAFLDVTDRQRPFMAKRFGVFQCFHGIERFARLRNGHNQRIGACHGIAVAVFAGNFDAGRNAGNGFQPVTRSQTGIVAGAAGENLYAIDLAQDFSGVGSKQFRHKAIIQYLLDRIGQRLGLFVDFLLHEVAVRPEFQRSQRDIRDMDLAIGSLARTIQNGHAIAAQLGHITLFQENHLARGRQDGGHIGSNEVFPIAQADQQWTAHAGTGHHVRLIKRDDGNGIGAGELLDRRLHCDKQIAFARGVVVVNQMGDDFGIGLRFEHIAELLEVITLFVMVFDDAVVHHCHQAG